MDHLSHRIDLMAVEPIAERDVYRPTMSPVRNPSRTVQVVLMQEGPGYDPSNPPEPPPEPLVVAEGKGSNWLNSNVYEVGQTVEARTAQYSGGVQPVAYKCRFSTRATADDPWVNGSWTTVPNEKTPAFFEIVDVGQIRFQTQAKDASEEPVTLNSVTGVKTVVTPKSPLFAEDPTASGTAMVGETLTCTQPVTTGGSPPYTFSYAWVDASGDLVFENGYLLSDFVPTDADVGKTFECVVTVTDQSTTRQTVVVRSNTVGPIAAHPPEVVFDQNTTPLGFTVEQNVRNSINIRARGYYTVTYKWEMNKPDFTGWVAANLGNIEALYPDAIYTLCDGTFQEQLSLTWFSGSPGPTTFRCAVTDTEMEPTPGGAMPVASTTSYSENCIVEYPG